MTANFCVRCGNLTVSCRQEPSLVLRIFGRVDLSAGKRRRARAPLPSDPRKSGAMHRRRPPASASSMHRRQDSRKRLQRLTKASAGRDAARGTDRRAASRKGQSRQFEGHGDLAAVDAFGEEADSRETGAGPDRPGDVSSADTCPATDTQGAGRCNRRHGRHNGSRHSPPSRFPAAVRNMGSDDGYVRDPVQQRLNQAQVKERSHRLPRSGQDPTALNGFPCIQDPRVQGLPNQSRILRQGTQAALTCVAPSAGRNQFRGAS